MEYKDYYLIKKIHSKFRDIILEKHYRLNMLKFRKIQMMKSQRKKKVVSYKLFIIWLKNN